LIVTLRVAQEERIAQHVAQCTTAATDAETARAQLSAVQADTKASSQRSVRDAAMIKELRKELAREKKKLQRVESELSAQPASAVSSLSASPKPIRRSHRWTPSASSNRSLTTVTSMDSFGTEPSDGLGTIITQDEQASLLDRMTAMQTSKAELEDRVRTGAVTWIVKEDSLPWVLGSAVEQDVSRLANRSDKEVSGTRCLRPVWQPRSRQESVCDGGQCSWDIVLQLRLQVNPQPNPIPRRLCKRCSKKG
jgi:hypothetical protein